MSFVHCIIAGTEWVDWTESSARSATGEKLRVICRLPNKRQQNKMNNVQSGTHCLITLCNKMMIYEYTTSIICFQQPYNCNFLPQYDFYKNYIVSFYNNIFVLQKNIIWLRSNHSVVSHSITPGKIIWLEHNHIIITDYYTLILASNNFQKIHYLNHSWIVGGK